MRYLGIFLAALVYAQTPDRQEIPLGGFASAMTSSRDGKFLLVMATEGQASVHVIEASSGRQLSRLQVPGAGIGLVFSADGRFVYAASGARNSVLELSWSGSELKLGREFVVAPPANDFIGDVAVSPDGRLIYATDLFRNQILVINPQSGRVIERFKTGRRPYRILFHPDGKSYFVSSWADAAVIQHQTADGSELNRIRLGPHPAEMVLANRKLEDDTSGAKFRIYVAAANTNNLYVIGIDAAKELRLLDTLNLAATPGQPVGMTPSGVTISADQTRLFVACSDANAVTVVDISETRTRVDGYIPAAGYPIALKELGEARLATLGPAGLLLTGTMGSPARSANNVEGTEKPAPVENVVYIMRALQPSEPLPNHEKLHRVFFEHPINDFLGVQGRYRAISGIVPDFTARLAPLLPPSFTAFEGEPANLPPAGFLWSNARAAGLSVRNYGELVRDGKVLDASLAGITNLKFAGTGPERARVFLDDLKQFEAANAMPRLTIVRLAGDAKDDDRALGMIIEGVSKSKFWAKTAVFVVDSNRFIVASPYTDPTPSNTPYTISEVLRAIELFLGLRPMTTFDAEAKPLPIFKSTANPTPFTADTSQ
jgi:YVTN family beta-propeller protein